jgi:hypothetical protein
VAPYTITVSNGPTFKITEDPGYHLQGAPWFVTSDTPDSDGDHTWGHFPTEREAVMFVVRVSTNN